MTEPGDAIALRLVWQKDLPAAPISSPSLADWNADGVLDIVDAMGFFSPAPPASYDRALRDLFVLDGRNGDVLAGWDAGGVDASPVVVDLGGDGSLAVVVGLRERLGLGIGRVGQTAVEVIRLDNWVTGPVIVDIDDDGMPDLLAVTGGSEGEHDSQDDQYISGKPGELIVWTGSTWEEHVRVDLPDESYASPAIVQPAPGALWAILGLGGQLHHGGSVAAYDLATGQQVWEAATATGVLGSPVLVEHPDGDTVAITIDWWGTVYGHRLQDGEELFRRATEQIGWNTPATAHLDDEPTLDIIVSGYRTPNLHFDDFEIGVNDKGSLTAGNGGKVVALSGRTGEILWSHDAGGVPSSPLTADLDDDGLAEVIVVVTEGSEGIAGTSGHLLVLDGATGMAVARAWLPAGAVATPAVADLDGNGLPNIIIPTLGTGTITVLETMAPSVHEVSGSTPQWRGSATNDGRSVP